MENLKRKILAITLVSCLGLSLLAGCSSDSGSNSDATTPTGGNETQNSTEEPVTLTIVSSAQTEKDADSEQAMADAFMDLNPNVTIEFIPIASNEVPTRIVQMATADDLPDAFISTPDLMATAYDMGIIIDHKTVLPQEYIDTITPSVLAESITLGDTMGYIPWFTVPTGLIYRTDWLEDAGLTSLETMDDFLAAAQAFSDGSKWGFSMVGTNNGSGTSRFLAFMRAYGIDAAYQDESGMWVSDLTTDTYKQALQDYVDLDLVHDVVPPGAAEADYTVASNYFAQEQTGLMITGSNAVGVILSTNPELDGKIGAVAVPSEVRNVSSVNALGYAITTACEHPELVAEYLMFMTEEENAVPFALASGRLPTTTTVAAAEELQTPVYKGFLDGLQYAIKPISFPGAQEIYDVMGESYNSMLGGNVTIDEAMDRVISRTEEILEDYNK